MKDSINWKKIAVPCAAFILLIVVILSGLLIAESTFFNNEPEPEEPSDTKTVEKDDKKYFPKQNITTLLLMGIDSMEEAGDSGFHTNDGLADVVALLIFDEETEEINILAFNRDSIVEMPVLGFDGKSAGTTFGQLALAHTQGNGLEESCENVKWAVSNLLSGVYIDYYISLNMGAVPILNDAVGGVTVNVKDDFSKVNPDIKKGEYTLSGDEALTFVRARKDLGDQLNISRMERQKEYVYNFAKLFREKMKEDSLFAIELLDYVGGYVVTDCSGETLAALAERYEDYELKEIVSPKGENIRGEDHYEFYIDEEDFEELKLRLLYSEK